MSRTIINRYLLREFLGPICLCLLVFTLVLTAGRMVQLVDLVVNKGVALADILLLLATILPPLLAFIVPLSFLMGIMLGFGRLCADGEIIALKANGTGLLDMARPVFLLAVVTALLTMAIVFWAAPWGKQAFRATLFDITSKQASIGLQQQVFLKQFSNLVLYTNGLDERSGEMSGVFVVEKQPDNPLLIFAEAGQVQSDALQQTVTLQLKNGVIHRQKPGGRGDSYQVIGFTTYDISPDLSTSLSAATKPGKVKRNEMSMAELWAARNDTGSMGRAVRGELHSRLCAPLAPLLFALLALPFSTFTQRSGRSGGFIVGLGIYLTYYMLVSLAETLTAKTSAPPLLAFWLPHLVLFVAGGWMLRRSALERPTLLVLWLNRLELLARQIRMRYAHH